MEIKSKEIVIVPIEKLKFHEKNPNKHPPEQIDRLCKIIQAQGFRSPLIVSNQSGMVVAGNGRLEAAIKLGMKELPVIFEDFENSDLEYAHLTADNALNSWSELDLSLINLELENLGPDLDIELLGLKNFEIVPEKDIRNTSSELDMNDFKEFQHECPKCGFGFNDV